MTNSYFKRDYADCKSQFDRFLWVHLQLEVLTSQSLEIDDIDEFLKERGLA